METILQEQPHTFFNIDGVALTNFSTVGQVVIQSDPIPENHVATLKDLNTMFTTAGGSVDYAKKTKSGKTIKFSVNRQTDDNGSFNINFYPGERAVILLNTAGAGVLSLVWEGIKKRTRNDDTEQVYRLPEDNLLVEEFN